MGETTLIQTTDPRSKIQVPRTLKLTEVTFPLDWTLENENFPLQIQNLAQNPDLDFVQELTDGTVRLSFDQFRFKTPSEYDEPRSRSPIDLHQPSLFSFEIGLHSNVAHPDLWPHSQNLEEI